MPQSEYLWTSLYSFLVDIKNLTIPYADYKKAEANLRGQLHGTYEYRGKTRPLYQLSTLEEWFNEYYSRNTIE